MRNQRGAQRAAPFALGGNLEKALATRPAEPVPVAQPPPSPVPKAAAPAPPPSVVEVVSDGDPAETRETMAVAEAAVPLLPVPKASEGKGGTVMHPPAYAQDPTEVMYQYYLTMGFDEETAESYAYGPAGRPKVPAHQQPQQQQQQHQKHHAHKKADSGGSMQMGSQIERLRTYGDLTSFLGSNKGSIQNDLKFSIAFLKRMSFVSKDRDRQPSVSGPGMGTGASGVGLHLGEVFGPVPLSRDVFDRTMERLQTRPSDFSCEQLTDLVGAVGRLRLKDLDVYRVLGVEVRNRKGKGGSSFSVSELKDLCWGFTRGLELNASRRGIGVTENDRSVFEFLCAALKARKEEYPSLRPSDISTVVRCLATVGWKDLELFQLIGQEVLRRKDGFPPQDFSVCVSAFTRFGVPLRDNCAPLPRVGNRRDWERPPPPTKPVPMSKCGQ